MQNNTDGGVGIIRADKRMDIGMGYLNIQNKQVQESWNDLTVHES